MSTTTGELTATEPGLPVGGADVADVVALPNNQVAFASTEPWHGWDLAADGQFPTLGVLRHSSAGWVLQGAWTADQLNASSPGTCAAPWPTAQCSIAALGWLPRSGDLVAAQYFGDTATGSRSGGLVVLSPDGKVVTRFSYPNVSIAGQPMMIAPREVDVDPSGRAGDERFAVVFDVFGPNGHSHPSTVQELRFDGKSITPLSAPMIPGRGDPSNPLAVGVATYDRQGGLWVSLVHAGTFFSAGLAAYLRNDRGSVLEGLCATRPDWANTQWGQACPPSLTFPIDGGAVLSLMVDPVTGAMLAVNSSGQLTALVSDRHGGWQSLAPIDLGVNLLADRRDAQLSLRHGAVDPSSRALWLPIGQLTPASSTLRWPTSPVARAQWLCRVDLRQLLGR